MKATSAIVLGLAALLRPAGAAEVTPVQKVVQLLQGMLEKAKSEKHGEQVQYAAFKQFCDDTAVEKTRAIAESAERIEVLKADIQKNLAEAEELTREIAVLDEDISVWTGDRAASKKVRDFEKSDFDATHKDYAESIDALQRAIEMVKTQTHDRSQASFAQLSALTSLSMVPTEAKRVIDAFLQHGAAPEALGYESHSHGIVEMLSELLSKFVAERTNLEKAERTAQHEYELLEQDLASQIAEATKDRDSKAATKAKKLKAKATAEGELQDVLATKADDEAYLRDLNATCQQKASAFASRQQLRAEEIVAIEKAIEIISSGAVAGNADKHLPALVQTKAAGTALAQLRAGDARGQQVRARLTEFLRARASKIGSRALSLLALRAEDDPFVKVRKMIQDLVQRLEEEAGAEADHKGWCDAELASNEQTRKTKTDMVEVLHAEIDELEATIAKVSNEIADHTKAIAELDAAMKEATTLRQAEKAKNTETIADAQAAQAAVAQAVSVLKEFYAKAAVATSLVQKQPIPGIFESAYTGQQAENGGVIGMLEVIESDFARLEADTKASEESAQKAYDRFMADSRADKAQRTSDVENLTAKKQDLNQELTLKRGDLSGTQTELDAALTYYDKLKPSCIDTGVSYEDRVAQRQEEIASLHEALKILNGEA